MWTGLEKILETVSSYSTNAGKLWYLLVFVFRLIVVATVGQSVYTDEQSAFRCSTKVLGCDNVCYDRFSKISHIRYWAFQLIAVTAPAVVFHFYSLNVKARVEKIKIAENAGADDDSYYGFEESNFGSVHWGDDNEHRKSLQAKERRKLLRRRKSVGAFKQKKVYTNQNLVDLTVTREIRIAYFINVVFRIAVEAMSLCLAYNLFHFTDYTVEESHNPLQFILIRVPQVYRCDGENVEWACGQHLNLGGTTGYVPCWVSRPYEKTIFMCYMNVLSAICCILSVIELVQLTYKYSMNFNHKRREKFKSNKKLAQRSNRDQEFPTFKSIDETDGHLAAKKNKTVDVLAVPVRVEEVRGQGNAPVSNGAPATHKPKNVSMNAVNKYMKTAPTTFKKRTTETSKKWRTMGNTMQGDDDEDSVGSGGYHSSKYYSGSWGKESLASVSTSSSR